ncbi:uncharacterized protein MKK02DRAFT_31717 [Dioszegia hungarica]|uniref:BZIP domain-containing protein n=1 Tax=Dioszegia hungarica TaxID=4972 RepID=A0AA38HD84_9TREE|nr:uncharacterized protein MKK02DRAFT_31717 [Dioszegia hungarica]KAI9638241.1 hypothetical protein MKK02DRAFT_31717 [Dioszegia hungarica]
MHERATLHLPHPQNAESTLKLPREAIILCCLSPAAGREAACQIPLPPSSLSLLTFSYLPKVSYNLKSSPSLRASFPRLWRYPLNPTLVLPNLHLLNSHLQNVSFGLNTRSFTQELPSQTTQRSQTPYNPPFTYPVLHEPTQARLNSTHHGVLYYPSDLPAQINHRLPSAAPPEPTTRYRPVSTLSVSNPHVGNSYLPTGQESDSTSPRQANNKTSLPLPRVLPPPPTRKRALPSEPSLANKQQKTSIVRQPLPTDLPIQPPPPDVNVSVTPPTPTAILLPDILASDNFTDPLADLDAFFTQMDAEITDMGVPAWSFDDLFVEDAFAALGDEQVVTEQTIFLPHLPQKGSPAPSTESEQSLALDVVDGQDIFDFSTPVIGLMHSATDVLPPPYQVPSPDQRGVDDATMQQTFGAGYGSFGDIAQFGGDANTLGMGPDFISKLTSDSLPQSAVNINITPSIEAMLATTDWSASFSVIPTAIAPADLVMPSPSLKRKDSSSSDEPEPASDQPAKRPRGRPPKGRTSGTASPLSTRQSKIPSPVGTPLIATVSLDDVEEPPKRTASGKPSTARPKSVVPEKYFKDGSAFAITGMTMEQILSFPTFDELLKQVAVDKRDGAREFGERIADQRDKAKDAAKKSRDEKRQKIEQLEGQVDGLEDQVAKMRVYLQSLLGSGRVSHVEVAAYL